MAILIIMFLIVIVLATVFALCKIAKQSDEQAEKINERKENKDG